MRISRTRRSLTAGEISHRVVRPRPPPLRWASERVGGTRRGTRNQGIPSKPRAHDGTHLIAFGWRSDRRQRYSLMPSALRGSTICPVDGQAAGRGSHVQVNEPPAPSLPGAILARLDGVDCGHIAIIWACEHGHPVSRAARARNWDEPRRALDGRRATGRLERPWRTSSARPCNDELGGERCGDELAIGSARTRARRPSRGARAAQGRRRGPRSSNPPYDQG